MCLTTVQNTCHWASSSQIWLEMKRIETDLPSSRLAFFSSLKLPVQEGPADSGMVFIYDYHYYYCYYYYYYCYKYYQYHHYCQVISIYALPLKMSWPYLIISWDIVIIISCLSNQPIFYNNKPIGYRYLYLSIYLSIYIIIYNYNICGGFLKRGYPQIIHFNMIFH